MRSTISGGHPGGRARFPAAIFAALTCALVSAGAAQAQVWHGNDEGGIIPWSCENEAFAQRTAADYCARWYKYPRITGVGRQYGDFISFNCLWRPDIGRANLPAVPTRTVCAGEPHRLWTK
jgi:hypothetical protein